MRLKIINADDSFCILSGNIKELENKFGVKSWKGSGTPESVYIPKKGKTYLELEDGRQGEISITKNFVDNKGFQQLEFIGKVGFAFHHGT